MNSMDSAKTPAKPTQTRVDTSAHFAQFMDTIIDISQIGLWDWNLQTDQVLYSRQWEKIVGYEEGELPQHVSSWEMALLPDDRPKADALIQRHLAGETALYEAEFRMRRKDGSIIWAQDKGKVTEWDEAGKPKRLVGVLQDVTRLKTAEEELKEKTEQLDFIAQISGLGAWDWDLEHNKISYSDDYLAMIGYSQQEINGSLEEWSAFNHPDDLPGTNLALDEYLSGKTDRYVHETRMRHKDGHYIWTLDTGRIVEWDENGKPCRLLGGHLNIDQLKRAELKLQRALEENERYNERLQIDVQNAVKDLAETQAFNQIMIDANPYINIILNDKFQPVNCNPAALAYFGFSTREELSEKLVPLINASVPSTQPDGKISLTLADRFKTVLEKGYIDFETELFIRGARVPVRAIFKRLEFKDSFVIAAYMIDMRSLKQAKNELVRQDRILRGINKMAGRLLAATPEKFDEGICVSMHDLSESVEADHMYVCRNFTQDGEVYCSSLYDWVPGSTADNIGGQTASIPYSAMPIWWDTLSKGDALNMSKAQFPEASRAFWEAQGVQSVFLSPVFLRGEFWGFVGLSSQTKDKLISPAEEKVVQSGAVILVSAILRNEVNTNLVAAREEALASANAKSEFLSRMSHEIRTPMNAIIGMTTIAKRAKDSTRIDYALDKIDIASQQLLGIINDILDMSKIESGKFEIVTNTFNFEQMIQNVLSIVQVQAEEKKQTLNLLFEDVFTRYMVCDELRLSQVVTNLLTNAIKFTPEHGTISVTVGQSPCPGGGAMLRMAVKDSGIGISPEQQQRLFQSFEQADGGITRRFGGTGLGLAICKKIVNMMGGDIRVESALGQGSTFIFEVRFTWGEELLASLPQRKPRAGIRILVVDDSEDVRTYFQTLLAGFSLSCNIAASGGEAIEMVRQAIDEDKPYDLIFLDWRMPRMSGSEAAREIMQLMSNAVVIMISAASWNDIEKEVSAYGVTHFLPKPILPSVLYNTIVQLTDNTLVTPADAYQPASYHWQGRHVLLVEDVQINQEIILTVLGDTGVFIDTANNGLEAIELFTKHPTRYDLILMDVQMPEMDGLEATRRIRASGLPTAAAVPILAMTANAFKQDVQNCLDAGMNGHVSKPIDVDTLLIELAHYLDAPKDRPAAPGKKEQASYGN